MNFPHLAPSSSPSLKEHAGAVIQAMEDCLEENRYSGSNPVALRHMEDLASQLRGIAPFFGEKAGSIAHWASVFWSSRKHLRWALGSGSGADRVRQSMLHDLVSLRMQQHQLL